MFDYKFDNPECIPLSWRKDSSSKTLHHKAHELCFDWVLELSQKLEKIDSYRKFEKEIGSVNAKLFVEKELFIMLLPSAMSYIRVHEFDKYNKKSNKIIVNACNCEVSALLKELLSGIRINISRTKIHHVALKIIRKIITPFVNHFRLKILNKYIRLDAPISVGCEIDEGISPGIVRSELTWWDGVYPHADSIVGFLISPISDEQEALFSTLLEKGMRFFRIGFATKKNIYKSIPVINKPRIEPRFNARRMSAIEGWFFRRYKSWLYAVNWWYVFFSNQNIKVWIYLQETDIHTVAQRAAMDKIGGITVYRQRSEYAVKTLAYNSSHVVFCWNDNFKDYLDLCRNNNRSVITVGHSFGVQENIKYEYANKVKESLANNIKYIISIMDNVSGNNLEISDVQLFDLYSKIFIWASSKPDVCILIKKKKDLTLGNNLIGLEFEKSLIDEGRLKYIVEPKRLLPAVIISISDIVVGVNLSSAALEAAILRKNLLLYYPSSIGCTPIEKELGGKHVCLKADEVVLKVEENYNSNASFIVSSDGLEKIDKFADGKGPLRMGQYISRFIKEY